MSSASCSTQPGCGKCCGNSRYDRARGTPSLVDRERADAGRAGVDRDDDGHASASVGVGRRGCDRRRASRRRGAAGDREPELEAVALRSPVDLQASAAASRPRVARRASRSSALVGTPRRRGRRVKNPVEHSIEPPVGEHHEVEDAGGEERVQPAVARDPRRASRRSSCIAVRPTLARRDRLARLERPGRLRARDRAVSGVPANLFRSAPRRAAG